jgi:hypothetical protein
MSNLWKFVDEAEADLFLPEVQIAGLFASVHQLSETTIP